MSVTKLPKGTRLVSWSDGVEAAKRTVRVCNHSGRFEGTLVAVYDQ